MSRSIFSSVLGRQFWPTAAPSRPSLDVAIPLTTGIPLRPTFPMGRVGLGLSLFRAPQNASRRSFQTSARSSRSYSKRIPRDHARPRQSFVSGGLLLLGLDCKPAAVNTVTAAADTAVSVSSVQKASVSRFARQAWQSSSKAHPTLKSKTPGRRSKSSKTETTPAPGKETLARQKSSPKHPVADKPPAPLSQAQQDQSIADSVSKYLHLPKIPHRPTKEELLTAASGFWQRLRVRFKWFSIRSNRPWNPDEWGAFVSFFLFGHLVWILVGTTTFFSLIILFINTVFAQETLAKWIGDYLTQSAGLTVIFESAIVPKWKDGVITFRNVFVSRRPGQSQSSVQKGSPNAAAEAAAARQSDQEVAAVEEDDGNYTQFDVTINTVNVTLSFAKWWNGRGFLKDVEVKGVRGVVDRTSVHWTAEDKDPLSYRHEHSPGDFELDHFKMEDLLVTVHQPNGFRPFSISIYSCELPQLRRQWLFYDFLSAAHMSGSYDGSLFTIHPRQIHHVAAADDNGSAEPGGPSVWKKFSRMRIDGLKIDHLNRGIEGPFGWIYDGNVDIVADVMFPTDTEEGLGEVMAKFYEKMEEAATSNRYLRMLESNSAPAKGSPVINNTDPFQGEGLPIQPKPLEALDETAMDTSGPGTALMENAPGYLVMDLKIHLNDVRASVPVFSKPHIGYVDQALVRPIVAYINAKRTYIPISCRIVKRHTDFDGSWTVWDCGLLDDLGAEVYTAFAHDVEDQQNRVRRLKRVGLWTVSLFVHALLAGVAGDLM